MGIKQGELKSIKIEDLELWEEANVRKENVTEGLDDLANNIKQNGLQVPLLVKKRGEHYLVFSGQRRLLACAKAGLQKIPCFVFENISENDARVLSLSENLYRLSMEFEDKSYASKQLLKHFKSREKVAAALGVDVATVKRYLGFDALPDELKKLVVSKRLGAYKAIDIFSKFVDDKKAIKIAEELASIPSTQRKKKQSFSDAIVQARSSDSIDDIRKNANVIRNAIEYNILVPAYKSKTLEKIAGVRLVDKEDIALEFLLEKIDAYERGERT